MTAIDSYVVQEQAEVTDIFRDLRYRLSRIKTVAERDGQDERVRKLTANVRNQAIQFRKETESAFAEVSRSFRDK